MIYEIQAYSGLISITVPFAAALVRLRKAEERYLPFLLLIGTGLLSELTSFVVVESGHPNLVIINVYVLVEALLITWQFQQWGVFSRRPWQRVLYPALQASYVLWWLYESFKLGIVKSVNSYFILYSSFWVLLMSFDVLTREAVFPPTRVLRNAAFLISIGFVLFFTCALVLEIFWMYGLSQSAQFRNMLLLVMAGVNAFANLLFAYAILCIPTKFRYLKQ